MGEAMIKIVYASRATAELGEPGLVDLLTVSRERNESGDVTGMLLYAYGSFMQHLEGPRDAVDAIYASIEADARHGDIRLLAREPIEVRQHTGWWMGFEHPDHASLGANLPGYKPSVRYPLVDASLVRNATVAETLLRLYARNA